MKLPAKSLSKVVSFSFPILIACASLILSRPVHAQTPVAPTDFVLFDFEGVSTADLVGGSSGSDFGTVNQEGPSSYTIDVVGTGATNGSSNALSVTRETGGSFFGLTFSINDAGREAFARSAANGGSLLFDITTTTESFANNITFFQFNTVLNSTGGFNAPGGNEAVAPDFGAGGDGSLDEFAGIDQTTTIEVPLSVFTAATLDALAPVDGDDDFLQLTISQNHQAFGFSNLFYDNIRLTNAAIPEPASLALVGLGSLVLLARRSRKS